jgi:hypothetical protein
MFKSKTVFVVGAGASQEADLPTGTQLKAIIAEKLNFTYPPAGIYLDTLTGDQQVEASLKAYQHQIRQTADFNPVLHAARKIRNAMPLASSIDTFINDHSDDEYVGLCGKMAILQSIIEAEQSSKLYFSKYNRETFDPSKLRDTWYIYFSQLLFDGVTKKDLENVFNNISFIVFNYDRCVEQYLYNSLQTYYVISPNQADQLLENLTIIHPYGDVGGLPWKDVLFGGEIFNRNRVEVAQKLKTFTELQDDQAIIPIRQEIQQAETLVFLGFAFHDLNMKLLTTETESNVRRVFGTVIGISQEELPIVSNRIWAMLGRSSSGNLSMPLRDGLTCGELFQYFSRNLRQAG